jgi:predicted nucleotidyltransferase
LYNLIMSMTALDLSPEALKRYRPHEAIRRRKGGASDELSRRRRRALIAARKAADLLRREFGAYEVFVFGSLARRGGFTPWSDVDLAAFGIPPTRFFEAVGVVTGLSSEFKIDLIDIETCPDSLREAIETEGKAI